MKRFYSANWYDEIENRLLKLEKDVRNLNIILKKQSKKLNRDGYYYSCDRKKWIKPTNIRRPRKPTERPSKKFVYSYDQKKWVNV